MCISTDLICTLASGLGDVGLTSPDANGAGILDITNPPSLVLADNQGARKDAPAGGILCRAIILIPRKFMRG
jgi:hypothetical protein